MKYKHLAYTLLLALTSTLTQAQVKIGKNPTTITPGALLDIEGNTTNTRTVSLTNGNFGIGIIAPTAKLDVNGEIGFQGLSTNGRINGYSNQLIMQTGSSNLSIYNNTGSANLMTILNSGNIGVGTGTPTAKLDVNGEIGFQGLSTNGRINGYSNQLIMQAGSSGLFIYNNAGTASLMTILNNGAVGIGSSNPTARLEVVGNMRYADGSQGAGKVLTSDANGVAFWQQSETRAINATNLSVAPWSNYAYGTDNPTAVPGAIVTFTLSKTSTVIFQYGGWGDFLTGGPATMAFRIHLSDVTNNINRANVISSINAPVNGQFRSSATDVFTITLPQGTYTYQLKCNYEATASWGYNVSSSITYSQFLPSGQFYRGYLTAIIVP